MKNKERIQILEDRLNIQSKLLDKILTKLELDNEPQLKQLDQSVFDGLDEKWQFAAVDEDGALFRFAERPDLTDDYWTNVNCSRFDRVSVAGVYDASNWQNSLIERETNELTGSELCRAMLARGDKAVLCKVYDDEENDFYYDAISSCSDLQFDSCLTSWDNAIPINNQGQPLAYSDVGL